MGVALNSLLIFFSLIKLQSSQPLMDKKFQNVILYKDYLYQINPLLIIIENDQKSLLQQDKLNQFGLPTLTNNQRVLLFCSGYANLLAKHKTEQLNIKIHDFPKIWDPKLYFPPGVFIEHKFNRARCLSPMLASDELPNEKCANGRGLVQNIGFRVEEFLNQYRICFDAIKHMSAIFTTHKLFGSELLFPEDTKFWNVPMNRMNKNLLFINSVSSAYFLDIQEKFFRYVLGPKTAQWCMLFKLHSYSPILTAAPLTPPGDFYFSPLKTSTYIFENTVPVFTRIFINDLNIIQVLGRMLALLVNSKTLLVISGWFDILTMGNDKGQIKQIYLDKITDGNKYRPIPKFLYKIYYEPESKKGIAFLIINNPFYQFETTDFPCKHIGKKFIVADYFTSDAGTRNTVICEVADVLNIVKDIPALDISGGNLFLNIFDKRLPWTKLPTWTRNVRYDQKGKGHS